MKKYEKDIAMRAEYIGYVSAFGGLEIKCIDYGIDDYVVFVCGAWYGKKEVHRVKIYYNIKSEPNFFCHGQRVYFRDVLRKGV